MGQPKLHIYHITFRGPHISSRSTPTPSHSFVFIVVTPRVDNMLSIILFVAIVALAAMSLPIPPRPCRRVAVAVACRGVVPTWSSLPS